MTARSAPICETRLLTAAEVAGWARMAVPGDSLVWCSGLSSPPQGSTKDKVNALRDAGVVRPRAQRRTDGCWDHAIVKRAEIPAPGEVIVTVRPDAAMEKIFAALERCARRDKPAHSDRELARIAGLATRHQAAWRVRRLAETGRIAIAPVTKADGTPGRIVTVGGRRTAAP